MSRRDNVQVLALICISGLIMNLVMSSLASSFALPLYFDTAGTILIAALGGYVPGIAVGFFTNFFKSFANSSEMYYCSVNVLVAILTAYAVRRGSFKDIKKTLLFIPVLTFVPGILDLTIENFLEASDIVGSTTGFHLTPYEHFLSELVDKSLSVLIAYGLYRATPKEIIKDFRLLGQRQAPLSKEMKKVIHEQNLLSSSSLRTKVLRILTLSALLLSFSVAFISYLLFRDAIIEQQEKNGEGMVTMLISEMNPARIDDYINKGFEAAGYSDMRNKLYALKNSNSNVKYVYCYRFLENGCQVVFDIDTPNYTAAQPGEKIEFLKHQQKYLDDFRSGRPVPPIISLTQYGYLLSIYKPVYDSNGKCQCYVAIDFSMNMLSDYTRAFIIKLLALFAGCFIFIFAVGLAFIENNIVLPLNTLAYCARNFSYDDAVVREKNIEQMKSLKIKTDDEIENLYSALIESTENVVSYLKHLQQARLKVADMQVKVFAMDEMAHTDSLTGIKNKAAYDRTITALDKKIAEGTAEFCIAMIDVNFLKKINDTYGHERGNIYLMNACKLICAVFGTENVYRIGGDEFVVVIEGEKSSLCKYFVSQFKAEMTRKNSDDSLDPWEKTSAAVGVAVYDAEIYQNADEVFKKADAEMYANKLAMKAQRTD